MATRIDIRLQHLVELWRDGSPQSLESIPGLCGQLLELIEREGCGNFDRKLLDRAGRLSAEAERRAAACVEILTRTGSYSTGGALELSSRLITAGWEG